MVEKMVHYLVGSMAALWVFLMVDKMVVMWVLM